MKRTLSFSTFILLISFQSFSQVAIGTNSSNPPTPDPSAVLLLVGNGSQGLIIPTIQNISNTAGKAGMLAFSNNQVYYHNGTTWTALTGGTGSQGIQINGNTVSLNSNAGANFGLSTPAPAGVGQLLVWNGSAWESTPAPTNTGQILSWNQTTGKWIVTTPTATSNLSGDITGPLNSTLIANSAGNNIVSALNNAATTSKILPTQITAGSANQVLTTSSGGVVGWANPSTGGTISGVVAGTGLSGGGTSGSVTVNLANTAVAAGVYGNASNVGQFTVDPQGRITNATNVPISSVLPTLGGDISGTLSSATVTGIQGRPVATTAPTNGQILQFSSGQWNPASAVTAVSTTAPLTSLVAGSSVTIGLTSPLPVANGGTGVFTTPANGQLLIGNGSGFTAATLSAGSGINITNGAGTVTIASTGLSNPMTNSGDIIYGGTGGTPTRLVAGIGFLKGGVTPSYSAINLNSGDVAGTLPVSSGGTGRTTWNGVVYGSGSTLSDISTATPGQLFISTASTPSWQTMSGDATINQTGVLALSTTAATGNTLIAALNNSSAGAINGAKINANFGAGNISSSGTLVISGAASLSNASLQIGSLSYTWPSTQAAGTVLTNNGSGTLTWAPPASPFTTANAIPKGNGTTLVASSLTDDGTTVSTTANLSFPNITNSIQFPAVGAAAPPMMYMFASGINNNNRFVIAHSPSFPAWGLEYDDPTDHFHFNLSGGRRLSISGVGIGINQGAPINALDVNGGIAVGSLYSGVSLAPSDGAIIQGNVGIGNNAPTVPLDVTGNTRITGAVGIGTAPGSDDLTVSNGTSTSQLITSFNPSATSFAFAGSSLYLESGTGFITSSKWGINSTSGGFLILGQQSLSGKLWFNKNGNAVAVLDDNYFAPYGDSQLDLGTSSFRWNRLYYTSGVLGTSDVRLKNSIKPIHYGLNEIMKLNPVSFNWNKLPEQGTQLGLIAQEVKKLLPELVIEADNPEKTLALNHVQLIPVLIKAIQEQEKAIEQLRRENKDIKDLVSKYNELSAKVESLLKSNYSSKAGSSDAKEKP